MAETVNLVWAFEGPAPVRIEMCDGAAYIANEDGSFDALPYHVGRGEGRTKIKAYVFADGKRVEIDDNPHTAAFFWSLKRKPRKARGVVAMRWTKDTSPPTRVWFGPREGLDDFTVVQEDGWTATTLDHLATMESLGFAVVNEPGYWQVKTVMAKWEGKGPHPRVLFTPDGEKIEIDERGCATVRLELAKLMRDWGFNVTMKHIVPPDLVEAKAA